MYNVIHESDDILKGGDDLSVTLKGTPRRLSSWLYALFTHRDFVVRSLNIPLLEGDTSRKLLYLLPCGQASLGCSWCWSKKSIDLSPSLPLQTQYDALSIATLIIKILYLSKNHLPTPNALCEIVLLNLRGPRTIRKSTFLLNSKNREEIRLW